ncbi:MAG: DUF1642 domain-containing protein [Lactococcus lactis]|nr:DUF1642 domain-containing protein [Lactococcus lactis]MDN5439516.1 DUF1642 domain-containing protein [Lactococcus lactis]MDN5616077.1 DUF1642 domain-containing protein [Lactococcus lactis]MDN5982069.1 DUF1642 domain-containing protein [Lactococcus lactis]MDN5994900.1 DUF1642 domain-containing protein [Lactococcus lactis]
MTKFEEEVKRPKKAYIDPFSKRDVDFTGVAKKFTEGAQTLKEWKEYAFLLEDKLKLQQQALPVVPERVADYISELKEKGHGIQFGLMCSTHNAAGEGNEKAIHWKDDNAEDFARAWLDGYTVEKQQQKRYEVKLLSGESMHFNPIGNPKNIKDYRFSFGNYAGWKTQFTKSELAEIKDGTFMKKIPGGTPLDDLGKDKSYYVRLDDCNYWINPLIELVPVEDGE